MAAFVQWASAASAAAHRRDDMRTPGSVARRIRIQSMRSMNSGGPDVALLLPDAALFPGVPRRACVKRFSEPDAAGLASADHVIVLVSLANLEWAGPTIKIANERRVLRWILLGVSKDEQRDLLPPFLNHVRIRCFRNALAVGSESAIPRRIVNAFCIGAEAELIADATAVDDQLFVVNCAADSWLVPFEGIRAMRQIPRSRRADFIVAEDGSHIVWPSHDVHLDLQSIRFAGDPEYRDKVIADSLLSNRKLGEAIAKLRGEADLRQSDIEGLSERQVRRIEHGEGGSLAAFRLLATAHGMEVAEYLDRLAIETGR